jgi:hypothetical protein
VQSGNEQRRLLLCTWFHCLTRVWPSIDDAVGCKRGVRMLTVAVG